MDFEEHFAPNACDNSDNESISSSDSRESVELPVKRYATRSQNANTVIKTLKEDNLKMIKEKLKKDESEQLRYLSLDNASKDVEIENLQLEIMKYESIMKPILMYEEAFKNFEKNFQTYKRLIDEVPSKEYNELIMSEAKDIVLVVKPDIIIPEIKYSSESLEDVYTTKQNLQKKLSDEFHEKMFHASIKKRRMYKVIDYSLIVLLIFMYMYIQYYFGK